MTIASIEHVLVLSDDIEATREFYCSVVGLSVGERPPLAFPGYWLYAGGAGACVHVAERRAYAAHAGGLGLSVPVGNPGTGPIDHVAFSATDFDEVVERVSSAGVVAVVNKVPGGPRQLFFDDPNGVRVEVNVWDRETDQVR